MASVTGYVRFNATRSLINSEKTALAGVPVVLQNIASGQRLTVMSGTDGSFGFENVPEGMAYRIVLAYGEEGLSSPGDFSLAQIGEFALAKLPPITYATNPPLGATHLDCLMPATILTTPAAGPALQVEFLLGPISYTPITSILDSCAALLPENLLEEADFGTFGSFPAGTPANTGAPGTALNPPYPNMESQFTYVMASTGDPVTPNDGDYTIQNIMNNSHSNRANTWWRVADRTTGMETGRMMVVNGYEPGDVIFGERARVSPHTNYLFSAWVLNLIKRYPGYADPLLGVQIINEIGEIIYDENLTAQLPPNTNFPEWHQIGAVINPGESSELTLRFLSQGPASTGNDYVLDDLALNEIELPLIRPVKSADKTEVSVGEELSFTIEISNHCDMGIYNVHLQDILPPGLCFVPGSVVINGALAPEVDLEAGLTIASITKETKFCLQFSAQAQHVPLINPAINIATLAYDYSPVQGDLLERYDSSSNPVPIFIVDRPGESPICKAIAMVVGSVALAEAGLSHILNAEGEKIQKTLSLEGLKLEELVAINASVAALVKQVEKLERSLGKKLGASLVILENCKGKKEGTAQTSKVFTELYESDMM